MKKYIKLNNILGVIVLLFGLSKLNEPMELLNVLGIIYYVVASIFLFKKPKIGYILLTISILGLILVYVINYYINSY